MIETMEREINRYIKNLKKIHLSGGFALMEFEGEKYLRTESHMSYEAVMETLTYINKINANPNDYYSNQEELETSLFRGIQIAMDNEIMKVERI